MMLQLAHPIPMWTPGGYAQAHIVIDYGMDQDLQWVTFLVASGECRTYLNKDVRLVHNETMGRTGDTSGKVHGHSAAPGTSDGSRPQA